MLSANLTCINSDYISNLPILTPDNQTLLVAEVKTEQDTYISGRISLPQAILNAGINLTNTPADTWITTNSSNIGAATSWFLANNIRIGRATNWVLSNSTGVINAVTWLMNNSSDLSDNVNSSVNLEVTLADITVPTNVQHNLNTTTPLVQVLNAQGEQVGVKITIVDSNNLTILPLSSVHYFNAPVANGDIVSVTIAGGTVAYDAENTNITNFIVQNSATLIETANTVQSLTADEFLQNIITAWVDTNSGVITDAVNWIHILSAVREKHIDLEMAVFAWVTANSASLSLSNLVMQNLPAYTTWVEDNSSTLAYTYDNIQSVPVETENATTWVLQNTASFEAVKTVLNDVLAGTSSNKTAIVEVSEQIKNLDTESKSTISSVEELQGELKGIEDKIQPLQTSYKWWEDNNAVINSVITWAENVSTTLISKAHLNAVEDLFKPIKTWVANNSAVLEDIASYIEHSDKTDSIISKQSSDIIDLTQKISFVLEKINNTTPAVPVIIDNIKDNGWLIANKEDIIKSVEWYNKNSQYILNTLTNLNNPVVVKNDGTTEILVEGINKQIATLSETSTWVSGVSSLIAASLLNSDWLKNNKAAILDISNWVTNNSAQLVDNSTSISDIKTLIADITIANADKVDVDIFKSALEQITTAVKTNSETLESHGKLLNNCLYAYQWVNSNKDAINTTIETVKSHGVSITELQNNVSSNNKALELISNEIKDIDERLTSETQKLSNYADIENWISANKNQLTNVSEVVDKNSNSIAQINQTIESIALNVRFSDEKIKKTTNAVDSLQANLNKLDEAINWLTNNQDNNSTNDFEKNFSEKIIKIDECVKWFDDNKETLQDTLNIKISEPLFKNWVLQNSENITNVIKWVEDYKNVKVELQDNINSINQQLDNIVYKFEDNKNTVDVLSTWVSTNSGLFANSLIANQWIREAKTSLIEALKWIDENKENVQLSSEYKNTLSDLENNIKSIDEQLLTLKNSQGTIYNELQIGLNENLSKLIGSVVKSDSNEKIEALGDTINNLINSVTSLEDRAVKYVSDIDIIREKIQAASVLANVNTLNINSNKNTLENALKDIDSLKSKVSINTEAVEVVKKSLEDLQLSVLNKENSISSGLLTSVYTEIAKLRNSITELSSVNVNSVVENLQIENYKLSTDEDFISLQSSIEKIESGLHTNTEVCVKLTNDISFIKDLLNKYATKDWVIAQIPEVPSIEHVQSFVSELAEQISLLNIDSKEKDNALKLLDSEIKNVELLRAKVKEIESLSYLDRNLFATKTWVVSQIADLESVKSAIDQNNQEFKVVHQALETLRGDNSLSQKVDAEISAIKQTIADVSSSAALSRGEAYISLQGVRNDIIDIKAHIDVIENQISTFNASSESALHSNIESIDTSAFASKLDVDSINNNLIGLEQRLAHLVIKVSTLKNEEQPVDLESINASIDLLKNQITKVASDVSGIKIPEVDLTDINSDISNIKAQIAALTIRITTLNQPTKVDLTGINDDISAVKENLLALEERINTSEKERSSIVNGEINTLKNQIVELNVKTHLLKPVEIDIDSINSNFEKFNNSVEDLNEKINDITLQVNNIKPTEVDLSHINSEINTLKSVLAGLTIKVATFKPAEVDLTDINNIVNNVNLEVDTLKEQFSNITKSLSVESLTKNDLDNVVTEVEKLKLSLAGLTIKVTSIKPIEFNPTEFNNEIANIKNSISDLSNTVYSLSEDKDNFSTQVVEADFSGVNQEISSLKQLLAGLTIKVATLKPTEVDLSGITQEVEDVKHALTDLASKALTEGDVKEVDLTNVNNEISTLKQLLAGLTIKIATLKPAEVDLSGVVKEIEQLKSSVRALNDTVGSDANDKEISNLKSLLVGYEQRLTLFAKSVSNYTKILQDDVFELKNKSETFADSNTLNDSLTNIADNYVKCSEKIESAESTINQLLANLKNIDTFNSNINAQVSTLATELNDIKILVENTLSEQANNNEFESYKIQVINFDNRISDLDNKLNATVKLIGTLANKLETVSSPVLSVEENVVDKVCDCEEIVNQINNEVLTLKDLVEKYNTLSVSRVQFSKTVAELTAITDELKNDINNTLNSISFILEANQSQQEQIKQVQGSVDSVNAKLPIVHTTLNKHTEEISKILSRVTTNTQKIDEHTDILKWYIDSKDKLDALLLLPQNVQVESNDNTWFSANSALINNAGAESRNALIKVTNLSTWVTNNFNEVNNSINEIKETVREQVDITTNLQEWLTANSRTLSEFAGTLEKYSNLSQNNNIWINSNEKQLLNSAKWVEDFSKLILTKIDNLQELTKNHKSVEDFIESNKEQILYWHNWLSDNADFVNKSTTWLQVLTSVKTQQTLKEIPLSITNEQADEAYNWVQSNSATYDQIANWYDSVQPELLLYSSWLLSNVSKIIETITWVNSNSGAFAVTQAQAFKTLMYSTSSSDWITYWGDTLITRSNWVTGNSAAFANIKNSTEWFVNNQGKGTQALTWVLDNSSKISETARWVTLLSGARECHAALEREVFAWVMANSDITWVESWIINNSACVYDACNWVRSKSAAFDQLSAYTDETSAAFLTAVNWVITNSAEIETNIDWVIANKTDLTTLCANYQPIFTDVISAVNWYKLSAERVSQAVEWVEDWSERTEWSVCWVEGWRDIVEDTVAWASSNSADYEAAYSWTKNNSAEFINHRVNIDYLLSATVSSINYFPYFKDALENLQTLSAAYLLDEGGNDCGPCTWPWEEPITRPVGALVDYHTNLRVLTGMTALEILSAILYGPQDIQFTLQPLTTAIRWDNPYTLTAEATSTSNTITYQWYRVSGSTNTLIAGATLSSYQLDKSTYNKTDTRKYIVVATDTTTSKKATSTPANVFIVYHPTFTDQPDSTTAGVGDSVTFSTTISNGFGGTVSPTYQWYRKGSGEAEYAVIAGATSGNYTRTVQGDDNNASFKVVVSGAGSFNNSNPSYQQQLYSTINELSTDESTAAIITLSYNFNFVTQPQTSAVRLGNTHTFFASATSDAGIVTYQWYNVDTGLIIDGETNTSYSTNVSGRYGVSAFDTQNTITSNTATLFTALTPVFTLQPNDANAPLNTDITLTSNATGTETITYQWYRKNAGVLAYSKITGATSKNYTFNTSQTDDGATFIVVASGPDTWKPTQTSLTYTMSGINDLLEVSSTAALIDIKNVPVITLQPTSSAIKTGNTHTFTASATSGDMPIVYQWYKGSITNTGFTILPNETTVTLSASSEGTYYLQASNANGTAQSSAAYLYITYPVGFTTTPQNTSVNVGSTATFTSTTTGTPTITYKWYKNSTLITNATSPSYTTPAAVAGDDNATFMVVASSPKTYPGSNGVTYQMTGINDLGSVSATAVLDVKMLPEITLQPSSSAIRIGNTHTFTSSATSDTGSVTYQWYKGDINGANYIILNSQTSISLTADVSGTYRLVASNVNGSVSSSPGYLWTLTPVGFTTALTSPVSVNLNATKAFTVATSGSPTITYRWYKNSTLITGAISTSYTTSAAAAGDEGATFMVVASSPKTYTGNSVTYQMTGINDLGSVSSTSVFDVLFPPVIVTNPLTSAVKLGNSYTFVASATSETPFTYQWYKSPSTIIAGQTNNTLITSVSGTYFVRASNVAGTTDSTTANLSTALVVGFTTFPASVTAVAGATVTYTSLASGTETSSGNITYQWYRKNEGDLTYTLIPGETNRIYSFNAASTDDGDTFMVVASAPDSAWGYPMTGVNDLSTASATCTFTLSTPPAELRIFWAVFPTNTVNSNTTLLSSDTEMLDINAWYDSETGADPTVHFPLGKYSNGIVAIKAATYNPITTMGLTETTFSSAFFAAPVYSRVVTRYSEETNLVFPDTTNALANNLATYIDAYYPNPTPTQTTKLNKYKAMKGHQLVILAPVDLPASVDNKTAWTKFIDTNGVIYTGSNSTTLPAKVPMIMSNGQTMMFNAYIIDRSNASTSITLRTSFA